MGEADAGGGGQPASAVRREFRASVLALPAIDFAATGGMDHLPAIDLDLCPRTVTHQGNCPLVCDSLRR